MMTEGKTMSVRRKDGWRSMRPANPEQRTWGRVHGFVAEVPAVAPVTWASGEVRGAASFMLMMMINLLLFN